MSTVISDLFLEITDKLSVRMRSVMERETLSDYVRRIKHTKNLTLNQIEKNSKGEISRGYVHDILNNRVTNPSVAKLQALARGLGIEPNEIIAVARGKAFDDEEILDARFLGLLENIKKLKSADKDFVLNSIESLSLHVQKTIEGYEKTPSLYAIDGKKDINIREFVRAVREEHPEFDAAEILDILDNHDIEKYTDEQIAIIRGYEDLFRKKGSPEPKPLAEQTTNHG